MLLGWAAILAHVLLVPDPQGDGQRLMSAGRFKNGTDGSFEHRFVDAMRSAAPRASAILGG